MRQLDLFDVAMAALTAFFIGMALGAMSQHDHATAIMQRRAVEVGAADWAVKPDGEVVFVWREQPTE